MTLTLHHIKNTRSLRPLWLMEELGLDYKLINEGAHIGMLDKQAYKETNPLGKMPAFFDGEKRITESVAIIDYIATLYGGDHLRRTSKDDDFSDYLQLLHFGEAGMGGYMSMVLGHTLLLPEKHRNPLVAKWALGEMQNATSFLEEKVRGDYLLGDFSLADISVAYILFLLKISKNGSILGPKLTDYFARIKNRPAWIKASSL